MQETFMFISMQKINLTTHFFLKTLKRNPIIVILGDLGMPGHTHVKRQYQFEVSFDGYLQDKNHLHPQRFSGDVAKICKLLTLGTLGMPGYADLK